MAPAIEYLHQAASWPARARTTTGTYKGELQRLLTGNAIYDPWVHMENAGGLWAPAWRFEAILPLKGLLAWAHGAHRWASARPVDALRRGFSCRCM
jgi:hypothetical protein